MKIRIFLSFFLCMLIFSAAVKAEEPAQISFQQKEAFFEVMMGLGKIDPDSTRAFCQGFLSSTPGAAAAQNTASTGQCCAFEITQTGQSRYYRDGTCERKSQLNCAVDGCQWTNPPKC